MDLTGCNQDNFYFFYRKDFIEATIKGILHFSCLTGGLKRLESRPDLRHGREFIRTMFDIPTPRSPLCLRITFWR